MVIWKLVVLLCCLLLLVVNSGYLWCILVNRVILFLR